MAPSSVRVLDLASGVWEVVVVERWLWGRRWRPGVNWCAMTRLGLELLEFGLDDGRGRRLGGAPCGASSGIGILLKWIVSTVRGLYDGLMHRRWLQRSLATEHRE
jgi:hypothetical protein